MSAGRAIRAYCTLLDTPSAISAQSGRQGPPRCCLSEGPWRRFRTGTRLGTARLGVSCSSMFVSSALRLATFRLTRETFRLAVETFRLWLQFFCLPAGEAQHSCSSTECGIGKMPFSLSTRVPIGVSLALPSVSLALRFVTFRLAGGRRFVSRWRRLASPSNSSADPEAPWTLPASRSDGVVDDGVAVDADEWGHDGRSLWVVT